MGKVYKEVARSAPSDLVGARAGRLRCGWFAWFAFVLIACIAATAHADESKTFKNGDYEFAVAPAPAWVARHEIPAQWNADAPGATGARWREWLFDTQVDRRRGARKRYYDRVYEPVSNELVQDAGKYQIWFSPDHQKLIIHRVEVRRGGAWSDRLEPKSITLARRENEFERDMANGVVSALIVLDDVRAGDLVRVSYTIDGDNPVLAGLTSEDFGYGTADPMLQRYARVLFDSSAKLSEHVDAGAPKPTRSPSKDALEWRADKSFIPGIVDEGSYPSWYDAVPAINVSESRSWADVAAWARTLYPSPAALPAELEQRIGEWKKLPDPERRLVAALQAVQEEVRYFGTEMGESTHKPGEPAETWRRRYGDCKDKARLLATLLERLEIEARPALASYGHGKAVADLPPSASVFDHVIVEARLRGTTLWLDATQTQQRGSPFTRVPGNFGVALPIAEGTRELVKVAVPETAIDRLSVVERLRPAASDKGVALEINSEYAGSAADRMRRRVKTVGNDKIGRDFVEYYRKRYGDVEVVSAFAVADDEAANVLKINERYLLKDPWINPAGARRSLDLYADALSSNLVLPKTAVRTAPMRVEHPLEIEQKTTVELPEGWQWLGEPAERRLESVALEYEARARRDNRVVEVFEHMRTRRDAVEPGDYSKHFALLREASDLLGHRLTIALPTKDAERERDKRLENLMRNILDDAHTKPKQEEN